MINRDLHPHIAKLLTEDKIILLLGARQVGKTTLIKKIASEYSNSLFLQGDEPDIQNLFQDAGASRLIQQFQGKTLIIIDEAQQIENIGLKLKPLFDSGEKLYIIATGSSAFELRNKANEPLTGRYWLLHMFPLSFQELANHYGILEEKRKLMHRLIFGCYPEIVNSNTELELRLKHISESYLYKDVLAWQNIKKPNKLIHLLKLLSQYVGQEISTSKLGNELGLDNETVENYMQILEKAFVIFKLHAYSTNQAKELKKSKKIYFFDNGIRNAILGDYTNAENRQDIGKLWENYIIAEMYKKTKTEKPTSELFFWRTHDQQEIDLIIKENNFLHAYEIKWNPKRKALISKTFTKTYPNYSYDIINCTNYDMYLLKDVITG